MSMRLHDDEKLAMSLNRARTNCQLLISRLDMSNSQSQFVSLRCKPIRMLMLSHFLMHGQGMSRRRQRQEQILSNVHPFPYNI